MLMVIGRFLFAMTFILSMSANAENSKASRGIIILSGFLSKSGKFTEAKTTASSTGILTGNYEDGNVIVRTVDRNGKILDQRRVRAGFKIRAFHKGDTGPQESDLDITPVVVSLPNSMAVAAFEVELNGAVIARIDVDKKAKPANDR